MSNFSNMQLRNGIINYIFSNPAFGIKSVGEILHLI